MITEFLATNVAQMYLSATESKRFGMTVSRLVVPIGSTVDRLGLDRSVGESGADLIIMRCASQARGIATWLTSLDGWRYLHADTLLYFSRDLSDARIDGANIHSDVVDLDLLRNLAQRTFASYKNHYSSNSKIPEHAVRDGYVEWLTRLLSQSTTRTFVVEEVGAYVSFVLACGLPEMNAAEIVLNGTHPDYESRGHYSRLLAMALSSFKSSGAERVWISTQASNRRAIRAWIRLGFNFEYAIDTYHLMPKISAV